MNSLIKSPMAHSLVVLEYRPANEWTTQEIKEALDDCIFMQDIVGAESIYARLKCEFQVLYEYSFSKNAQEPSPLSTNCHLALAAIAEIKANN